MEGDSRTLGSSAYVIALWGLVFLFCLRVAGQLIQVLSPVAWLPPLPAWLGSTLPYAVLFVSQLAIIFLMFRVSRRHASGFVQRHSSLGKWLMFGGAFYFLVMAARLVIGLADLSGPAWFHRPIPAFFHLVLASFVLLLAAFHLNWIKRETE